MRKKITVDENNKKYCNKKCKGLNEDVAFGEYCDFFEQSLELDVANDKTYKVERCKECLTTIGDL